MLSRKNLEKSNRGNKKTDFEKFKLDSEKNRRFRSPLFTKIGLVMTLTLSFLLFPSKCIQEKDSPKNTNTSFVKEDTTAKKQITPEPPTLPPRRNAKLVPPSELPEEGL